MTLEGATCLQAYMAAHCGPRGLYEVLHEDPAEVEPPGVVLLRVADAYSGDWDNGIYAACGGLARGLGRLRATDVGEQRVALARAVREVGKNLYPDKISDDTPAWALAEVFGATRDSHARALAAHLSNVTRRGSNTAWILNCMAFSLGMWMHSARRGDLLVMALAAMIDSITEQKEKANAA